MSKSNSTSPTGKDKEKQMSTYDYEADQPNRVYDKKLLMQYYQWALKALQYRNLSVAANFLQLFQIRFTATAEVPTACMMVRRNKREMWFNVNFLLDVIGIDKAESMKPADFKYSLDYKEIDDYYVDSFNSVVIERFAFLIAHELMHSCLGHMRKFYWDKMPIHGLFNVATDSYINHMLHKMGFEANLTEAYLNQEVLEWCSPFFKTNDKKASVIKDLLDRSDNDASVLDIYEYLCEAHADKIQKVSQSSFLGSHDPDGDGEGEGSGSGQEQSDNQNKKKDPNQSEEERRREEEKERKKLEDSTNGLGPVIRELDKEAKKKGCSKFGSMFEDALLITPKPSNDLNRAIEASKVLGGMMKHIKAELQSYDKGEERYLSNRPDFKDMSRSLIFHLAKDKMLPPFIPKFRGHPKAKAVIYLDVSGSLYHLAKYLYGLLAFATDIFDLEIKLFSTTLNPITISELRQGKVYSTGGTDFAVWAQDIIDEKYKMALVITDGWDSLDDKFIAEWKKIGTHLNYLLIDGDRIPKNMADHADNVWDLKVPQQY